MKMEQLKVRKKDTIIVNVIIFLALSFLFLYLQHAYRHHLSPFSFIYLKKGLELFWYLAILLVFSSIMIWRHSSTALFWYQCSIALVGFKVIEGLFIEFNKIIVVAMFFYVVISYFLYQLLKFYLGLARVNSNYSSTDLFAPLLKNLPCKIISNNDEVSGNLTNWDEDGCFIKLDSPNTLPDKISVTVYFKDREFIQEGEVVSSTLDLTGFGIRFDKKVKNMSIFNWSEFMEIAHELGFQPERLR